ncbi:hypothetical protein PMIN06_012130 [Paraphaeosphaeria minitans]
MVLDSNSPPPADMQAQLDDYRITIPITAAMQSSRHRRKFVLCFDGTGNKFSGTDADSNILKIYRLLDRNEDDQFHYYQPGIGTYVVTSSRKDVSHSSRLDRLKSWYLKAKDSAIGTSFAEHVMGGYKFLMRYYNPGDDIFFFGFSRGAYTARFLAEMLDHVGLLSAGNEEMCHFAWKTFQRWQCRQERNEKEKRQKRYLLEFMCAFRETFSRPVKPIRFLGLFDTVNSVPSFENAWMQRSKFPYTARSSARVIRHAVSIDERRAKFRQDLISQVRPNSFNYYKRRRRKPALTIHTLDGLDEQRRGRSPAKPSDRRETLAVPGGTRDCSQVSAGMRNASSTYTGMNSAATSLSNFSLDAIHNRENCDSDEGEQDIKEVWFAGCHADIGGGWPLLPGEDAALSHVPLVWMVREAQRAGLQFDEMKLRALNCGHPESIPAFQPHQETVAPLPTIALDTASPSSTVAGDRELSPFGRPDSRNNMETRRSQINHHLSATVPVEQHPISDPTTLHGYHTKFHQHLHAAATRGKIHDVLQFRNGATRLGTLSWKCLEWCPIRRMDLQEDGSWKAISWPLPKGEVRDIPDEALIHGSVIKRMETDNTYRPGNLIVGGGGRGVRIAPADMGMGKWVAAQEEGHAVGELFIRKEKPVRKKTEEQARSLAVAPNGPQGMFLTGR